MRRVFFLTQKCIWVKIVLRIFCLKKDSRKKMCVKEILRKKVLIARFYYVQVDRFTYAFFYVKTVLRKTCLTYCFGLRKKVYFKRVPCKHVWVARIALFLCKICLRFVLIFVV